MSKKNKQKRVERPEINKVDIVIPVYSNYPVLNACVTRLADACKNNTFKIIMVDDASPDYEEKGKTFYDQFNGRKDVKVIVRKQNKGFGYTVNDGMAYGNAPYAVILNTDVFLHEHAIDILVSQLEVNDDIAITSPKLLFPPNQSDPSRPAGRVQHAGMCFSIDTRPFHMYMGWDHDHPFVNRVKDYNIVSGACMAVKKDVWIKLKGFDINYGRGYYEDIDLCVRTRQMGLKIRYLPQAVGYHLANASMNLVGGNLDMERNYQYFRMKFGNFALFDEPLYAGP